MKNKLLAVIGPTACGKTDLAIHLAKKFNGELINTDSRQIYKYLDIGTAKGDVKIIKNRSVEIIQKYKIEDLTIKKLSVWEIENIHLHLINIIKPDKILSLSQYQKLAYNVIENITQRNKLPILVGGTGLYIDAIYKGYQIPKIRPDYNFRRILYKKSLKNLQYIMNNLSKKIYNNLNNSDKNNSRRLIRLIEIEKNNKLNLLKNIILPKFNVLFITPKYKRKELYKKINKRAEKIVKSGLIKEVKDLLKKEYKFNTPAFSAICYPYTKQYIEGKIDKKTLIDKFAQGDRNYARRQITWFKRYHSKQLNKNQAVRSVEMFLNG